jgi:predicted GH43/DUF377 family glycosyl hydrolase
MMQAKLLVTLLSSQGADSLLDGLAYGFPLEEAGVKYDVAGNACLIPMHSPTTVPAKVGSGTRFVSASGTILVQTFLPIMQSKLTGGSYEIVGWVNFSATSDQRIISKDTVLQVREWGIKLASGKFQAFGWFGAGAGTLKAISGTSFGNVSTGEFYFFDVRFDASNQKLGVSINRGAWDEIATGGSIAVSGTSPIKIGGTSISGELANSTIDEVYAYNRLLNDAERDRFYNGGNGMVFPAQTKPVSVVEFPEFTRHPSNPVLTLGAPGSWEDVAVANPDIFWDTPNNRWVMNYSGYDGDKWRTGLAYSADLLTWTKEPLNPVFGTDAEETYIEANGSILLDGSTYKLYYQKIDGTYLATSEDLLTWSAGINVSPTFDPMIRKVGSVYELWWYRGGYSTSSDGVTFVRKSENNEDFMEPFAFSYNEEDYVAYQHSAPRVDLYVQKRTSTTPLRDKVILSRNPGQWDGEAIYDACVVVHNGTIYLFYGGHNTQPDLAEQQGMQIGLATATA